MRILLIENDFSLGRKLKNLLEKNRYTVDVATVPGDALCYCPSSPFHLIIFGVSSTVPDKHSLSTLAELRQNRIATPLLYLCSTDAIEERIQALNTGADDCLPKSFAPSEFLARVRALGRRSSPYIPELLTLENTTLDCSQYLLSASESQIRLNNKEFQLMELFFRYPNKIFSPEHLMETFWVMDSNADINVIWTYISFLRKKLKEINSQVQIRTIRGAGYSLEKA